MMLTRDEVKACLWGGALAAVVVVIATLAYASTDPKLPAGVTCADVRANVARYGQGIALTWAKLNGYSSREITEAKRCLVRK